MSREKPHKPSGSHPAFGMGRRPIVGGGQSRTSSAPTRSTRESGGKRRIAATGARPGPNQRTECRTNANFLQECASLRRASRIFADSLEDLLKGRIPEPAELRALRNSEPELRRAMKLLDELLDRSALRHQNGHRTDANQDGIAPGVANAPATVQGMRCNLHGTIASMPLTSVLQMLSRANKSGVLRVQMGDTVLSFHFAKGKMVRSESTGDAGMRLGDLLVQRGAIQPGTLMQFMQSKDHQLPLGEALEQSGLVDRDTICNALEDQVSARVAQALRAGEAEWWFYEKADGSSDGRVDIDILPLLLGQLDWNQ